MIPRVGLFVTLLALLAAPTRADVVPLGDELAQAREAVKQRRFADAEALAHDVADRAGAGTFLAAEALDVVVETLWRSRRVETPDALAQAHRAVELKASLRGPDDPTLADSLDNLAHVLRVRGETDLAISTFERALALRETTLGSDHLDVSASLNWLGWMAYQSGQFELSVQRYERAVTIREAALGADSRLVADLLNNLAIVLRKQGRYVRARELYTRFLEIYGAAEGADRLKVATAMNNLAVLLKISGDLTRARPLYEEALRLTEEALGAEHPTAAAAVINLAALQRELGDPAAALALYERARGRLEDAEGPNRRYLATTLNNLGSLSLEIGAQQRALQFLEQALTLRLELYGEEHLAVAQVLNNLGNALIESDRREEAGKTFERALAIRESDPGVDPPGLARVLESVAELKREAGQFEAAAVDARRALEIYETTFGPEHPAVGRALRSVAMIELQLGHAENSFEIAARAERIGRDHLRVTARSLSERQALGYASVRPAAQDLLLSLVADGRVTSVDARRQAWDAVIRSRGLVLDELMLRRRDVVEDDALTAELAEASRRLSNLLVRGSRDTTAADHRRLLDEARTARESAERRLAEASAVFRRQRETRGIGAAELAQALPAGAALVAYVRADANYAVFVLRHGETAPRLISLAPVARIEALIESWRREIDAGRQSLPLAHSAAERRYRAVALELRRTIWDPVAALTANADQIYVVPDGALHLLSLDTLPDDADGYLAESAPVLRYMTAERDLVRSAAATAGRGLLAVGAPAFDEAQPVSQTQVSPSNCRGLQGLRFVDLPGSRREAEDIAALWPEATQATLLLGNAATESEFKRLAPGKSALHLATHGFFLGEPCTAPDRDDPAARELDLAAGATEAVISGLALAQANSRETRQEPDADDGILTAEEIAAIDLSGVEWVVLSGCDTGLGVTRAGEGVLGLRRSFRIAGARTLIMSLWSVEDVSARHFMDRLYRERGQSADPAVAARQASLDLLQARRQQRRSTHPFFWGAFVAVGDRQAAPAAPAAISRAR